jgi:hypothetical protein
MAHSTFNRIGYIEVAQSVTRSTYKTVESPSVPKLFSRSTSACNSNTDY